MCSAYKLGMTAKQGYVWFLPHWLEYNWYNTDDINEHHVNCTTKEMFEVSTYDRRHDHNVLLRTINLLQFIFHSFIIKSKILHCKLFSYYIVVYFMQILILSC